MDTKTLTNILKRRGFKVEMIKDTESVRFVDCTNDEARQDLQDCISSEEDDTTPLSNMLYKLGYEVGIDEDGKLIATPC